MKVLVLLQNAWRYDAKPGQTEWLPGRPPEISQKYWEGAMWMSPTGRNLEDMLPLDELGSEDNVRVGNASPFIGNTPSSKFPMAPDHVYRQVDEYQPDLVVLLGAEAHKARPLIEQMGIVVVEGPHPVARASTRADKEAVRNKVFDWINAAKWSSEHTLSVIY